MNAAATPTLPALGQPFEGGIYAGITLHNDRLAALVLVPGDEKNKTHAEALAWAKEQGGELPSRHDMLVLVKNVKGEFKTDDWYWTSEEGTGNAACAWLASFGYGYQHWRHEGSAYRCRAVRRVAI